MKAATNGGHKYSMVSLELAGAFVTGLLCLGMSFAQGQPAQTDKHPAKAGPGDSSIPLMIKPDSGTYFPYGYKPGGTPQIEDPLSSATAEYRETWPLFSLGGVLPLQVSLLYAPDLYNRTIATDGTYQMGGTFIDAFTTDAIYRLIEFEETGVSQPMAFINVLLKDDTYVFRDVGGGQFMIAGERKLRISRQGDYYYLMDPVTQLVYIFRSRVKNMSRPFQLVRRMGEVVFIMDRNGNRLSFSYNTDNNPTLIEDGLGRRLAFAYKDHVLESVSDGQGRSYTFAYANSELASFTDPAGQVTRFQYDPGNSNLLTRYTLPAGNSPITQTWAKTPGPLLGWLVPYVASQTDAYQNTVTLNYNSGKEQLTTGFPDGTQTIYESSTARYPEKMTDTQGHSAAYTYNWANAQMTKITDRMGDSTQLTYHAESGKPASVINAKGQTTAFTYTAQTQGFTNPTDQTPFTFTFYDMTRVDFPDGSHVDYSHDGKGNVLTQSDQAGKTWTYTYSNQGQLLTQVNPAGGEVRYAYSADESLASAKDSDTGTTTYGYDALRRINKVSHPDGKSIQIVYDQRDRVTSITDENSRIYSFEYDANGNLRKETNPKGDFIQYAYDLMDRLLRKTDTLGKVTTFGYDNRGRFNSVSDANGMATTLGYEARGWPNRITRGGKTWLQTYDDEGVISTRTTPLNHTTNYQTDKLGLTARATDPLGHATNIERDALNRITGITDPEGRTTGYGYDSRGLISEASQPGIGTADYQSNDLGLLSRITDPNGNNWTFDYTNMGRPRSETDPLGNTWEHTYDQNGRLSQTTYPDGVSLTHSYDNAGNLTGMNYSGGSNQQFTYDELDRLIGTDGISFTRDKSGRITATSDQATVFGAGYDDGGRLKTVTYNGTTFTVTYTYDAVTGRLSRVTDNLTNARVDFAYDNDGRPIGVTRSNGVNATLTWDEADQITRIKEGSFMDVRYVLNDAGQMTEAQGTVPLDPENLLAAGTATFNYDDASRLSSAGYLHDTRGRLTTSPASTYGWDSSSNLIQIDSTTLSYNGMGDLRTRTQGGQTIRYFYNYAIDLSPIVAEENDAGQMLRYYVWTPTGALLYMIDVSGGNKVYFYHFDRNNSTLALTNSAGAVTDKYAYDPYGKLLGHVGDSAQPFTFVGQLGVRQEGAGGTLYHMRERYYDAGTQRFISRDPLWPQLANPGEINPYQYALSDPISNVDPEGTRSWWRELLGELLGEAVDIGLEAPSSAGPIAIGWAIFKGTPTGFREGDPEWGRFGSPIGSDEELFKAYQEGRQPINEGEAGRIRAYDLKQLEQKIRSAERQLSRAEDERKLREAGMPAQEAAAFMDWLDKTPFGAVRKQREFDFALQFASLGQRQFPPKIVQAERESPAKQVRKRRHGRRGKHGRRRHRRY